MAHYKKLSAKEGSSRENEEQKGIRKQIAKGRNKSILISSYFKYK